jgi:hypothetical protein
MAKTPQKRSDARPGWLLGGNEKAAVMIGSLRLKAAAQKTLEGTNLFASGHLSKSRKARASLSPVVDRHETIFIHANR